jgi:hypothetical protein
MFVIATLKKIMRRRKWSYETYNISAHGKAE